MNLDTSPAIRTPPQRCVGKLDDARARSKRAAWMWHYRAVPDPGDAGALRPASSVETEKTGRRRLSTALHAMPISSTYDGHVERNRAASSTRFRWSKRWNSNVARLITPSGQPQ